jgi:8-amino-3,8-dideoxy-alpha-D-manno-octulosonate transaminase
MASVDEKLAIDGGKKAKTTPNYPMYPGGYEIGEDEKKEVCDSLDKKYIFRYYPPEGVSSKVSEFEQRVADMIGSHHALGVNSCTSALISALIACDVGPGHEVIIPAYTYWSSASAVLCARAVPVVAEIDDSFTIDPDDLEKKITPRTKAIVPVHMRGSACNMDRVMEIAKKHNLAVIEDNAQACGGTYKGKRLGSFGNCGCLSFQYYKIITTGEGGMLLTDSEDIYIKAQSVHDSAACWRPDRFAPARFPGELFYGYDFRMSEVAGAIGLAQLRKLPALLEGMRKNKRRITSQLEDLIPKGITPRRQNDAEGDAAVCIIFYVPTIELCEKFVKALVAEGVSAQHCYHKNIPDWHVAQHWLHMIKQTTPTPDGYPYKDPARQGEPVSYENLCPKSADLLSRAVHIDVPPQMSEEDCDMVAEAIRKVAVAYL